MKKDKLKLKPTLKEKRHYLVVELISAEKINEAQAKQIVDEAILEFIGKLGYASAGPLYFGFHDMSERKGFRCFILVSVLTKYVDYVKTSLTLYSGTDKKVKMKCIGVSGTILKAKRFLK
jgi:RNase P/RNase MRP subunit POP5